MTSSERLAKPGPSSQPAFIDMGAPGGEARQIRNVSAEALCAKFHKP
jgi:hypothetical protein